MLLHLDHTPKKPGFSIHHRQGIFLAGSCFSTHIGSLLADHRFTVCCNPGGILFNPLSMSDGLQTILSQEPPDESYTLQRDGVFYSFRHHSSVHAASGEELAAAVAESAKKSFAFLKSCNYLILTFGTAFYYHHKAFNSAVANCHKQPGSLFEKRLLGVAEIVRHYQQLLDNLKQLNPALKIIFTVSPVKYLKDGLEENTLSKSTLILAIHELIRNHPQCSYFPAYELVSEDLRDYRFYKEDMAHPNEQAIQYVWEKFSACYFEPKTRQLNKAIHALRLAIHHRPMQEKSSGNSDLEAFIEKQKSEILKLDPDILL